MRARAALRFSGLLLLPGLLFLPGCSSVPKDRQQVTEKQAKAVSYSEFGTRYFAEGRYADALNFFSYALREQILADNRPGIIDSYYDIGRCRMEMGNDGEAEAAFGEGLRMAEREELPDRRARGLILSGELELSRGNPEGAAESFNGAIGLLQELKKGGEKELAVAYHDLGAALKQSGFPAEAEAALLASLAMNRKAEAAEEESNNLFMLASVLSGQNRNGEALILLEEALAIDRRLERSIPIAEDLHALGIVAERLDLIDKAYTSYGQSFMIYNALDMPEKAAEVLRKLSLLSKGTGDEERSAKYLQAAEKLEKQDKQSDGEGNGDL
jgi:tetratricopeptide (TPR) repeat protein